MEDVKDRNDKKRSRDDNDSNTDLVVAESKQSRINLTLDSDSAHSDTSSSISFVNTDPEQNSTESKRPRLNSPGSTQSESNNFQADFLEILDDPEAEKDQAIMGLDSVIRSFEEEILFPATADIPPPSRTPQPELGYLLEASDDELGIPPAPGTVDGEGKISAADFVAPPAVENEENLFELGLGFENDLPGFGDSFEFGFCGDGNNNINIYDNNNNNGNSEFVALGGLFDCSETCEGDLWRTEESMGAF